MHERVYLQAFLFIHKWHALQKSPSKAISFRIWHRFSLTPGHPPILQHNHLIQDSPSISFQEITLHPPLFLRRRTQIQTTKKKYNKRINLSNFFFLCKLRQIPDYLHLKWRELFAGKNAYFIPFVYVFSPFSFTRAFSQPRGDILLEVLSGTIIYSSGYKLFSTKGP